MASRTVSAVTQGVRVSVESFHLADRSDAEAGRWAFGYRITISNESAQTVQLLRRHWIITDAEEQVTEVYGDGVVGEQPVLDPGERHSYSSGAVLETPSGTMRGCYEMRDPSGEVFRVEIPQFVLRSQALH